MLNDKSSPGGRDWRVSIPFSDLHMLLYQVESIDSIRAENAQLRRELEGLRNLYNELLVVFGDLRRDLMKR